MILCDDICVLGGRKISTFSGSDPDIHFLSPVLFKFKLLLCDDFHIVLHFHFLQGGKYSTPDNRITIFACNLFDVTPEMVGKVDAVWDRGSFVALSCDTRPRYAALLKRLVRDSFR